MRTSRFFPAFFVAVIFLIPGSSRLQAGDVANRFGGISNAAIIKAPTSVRAWRTAGSVQSESSSPEDYYMKFGEAILVSTDLATRLSKVLLEEESYEHPA